MSVDNKKTVMDRRTLLRAGAVAALAAPIGAYSAQAFAPRPVASAIDFSEFPICKAASDAPPLTGAPRKLKVSWNAGAVCLAPLPVAIDHGFFQKQNLDVELVNLFRLDRPAARGDRHRQERCRARHGAALAEAARTGL